jgi:uncharacterized membrane protein
MGTAPSGRLAGSLSRVLQAGVLASAVVALAGGLIYLRRHGASLPEYAEFRGVPPGLDSIGGIVRGAVALRGRWITQLALLILVATPVARVALAGIGFARERDSAYVMICALVLAMLLVGFFA